MPAESFGFRPEQINNEWTVINGIPIPLDQNGNPFDPKNNPEKILWKDYTTIPRYELTEDLRNTFLAGIGLTQPIYMGGRIKQANKMAQIGIEIAKEQQNAEISEVLFNVENTYWTVVSAENKVKIASEYQKLLLKLNQDVTEIKNEGMATKADILKVRVKLNEVNINLAKAENGLNLARMQLCHLIRIPRNSEIILTDVGAGLAPALNNTIGQPQELPLQSQQQLNQIYKIAPKLEVWKN